MRYLGIDFGGKRIGIAVSDDNGGIAFPLSVIQNDKNLLENISKIIKKEKIEAIILGESKNFQNESNPIMVEIEEFKKNLEEKLKIKVFYEPEFLTSQQAKKIQGENQMHDASAAAIILQSYLDRK